jgi:hypothetical protein
VLGEQAGGAHHGQLRPLQRGRAQALGCAAVLLVGGLRVQAEVLAELPPVRPRGERVPHHGGLRVLGVLGQLLRDGRGLGKVAGGHRGGGPLERAAQRGAGPLVEILGVGHG